MYDADVFTSSSCAVYCCVSVSISPWPEVMSRLVATSLKLLMASSRATLSNMLLLLLLLLLLLERGGGVTTAVAGWGLQQLGSGAMVCEWEERMGPGNHDNIININTVIHTSFL